MRIPCVMLLTLLAFAIPGSLGCRSQRPSGSPKVPAAPMKGRFILTSPMLRSRRMPLAIPLPDGRALLVSSLEAERVNTIGNSDPEPDCTELYDPRSGSFYALPAIPVRGAGNAPCRLADGSVLFFGGYDPKESRPLGMILRYDPGSGTYETLPGGLIHPRSGHKTFLLENGNVLVLGGEEKSGKGILECELFDPTSGSCKQGPMLNQERTDGFLAVGLQDGRVLVAGGEDGSAAAEIYDPKSNSFKQLPDMGVGREYATAVLLEDGKVLIAGGSRVKEGKHVYESSAECFLPDKDRFNSTGTLMSTPRGSAAGILLPDNRVLILGGNDSSRTFGSTEFFTPDTNEFSPGPNMLYGRFHPSLVPLGNGKILVVGPYGAAAELLE